MAAPNLRCRPDLVKGMPIFRLIFDLAWEIPMSLFQENPPLFIVGIGLFSEILNMGAKGLMQTNHCIYHRFMNLGPVLLIIAIAAQE
jgi:hypothetical protein